MPDDQKLTPKDTMRELGRRWRHEVSDKEKDKYNKKAADEKKKLEAAKEQKIEKEAKTAAKKEINSKISNDKPEKKPINGYQAFMNNNREETKKSNPSWKPKEINKYLTDEWNKKSKQEKAEYAAEMVASSSD